MTAADRLCAALDFPSLAAAEPFARAVAPHVGMLKVGLELFVAEGPPVVRAAAALGRPVFLDLKLHDIPNTVAGAARSAAASGAALLSVHAAGGAEMVRAAVREAGPGVRVLAITVLTSLDARALEAIGLAGPPEAAVVRLAPHDPDRDRADDVPGQRDHRGRGKERQRQVGHPHPPFLLSRAQSSPREAVVAAAVVPRTADATGSLWRRDSTGAVRPRAQLGSFRMRYASATNCPGSLACSSTARAVTASAQLSRKGIRPSAGRM